VKKYFPLIVWWLVLSIIWGIFKLFETPEIISELLAKPIIWLGITAVFLKFQVIPKRVIEDLRNNFLVTKPIYRIFLLPILFIILYFLLINFRMINNTSFNLSLLTTTIIINFSTGIIEEIVYRGVMYVWLLQKTGEILAFVLVQILFLLGHIPTLIIGSNSIEDALTRSFFIILMGSIHTGIFRINKSLYSSSLSHGLWNTLVHYFLLG
jgi:membrane protease YdiL (CAAX protease family)